MVDAELLRTVQILQDGLVSFSTGGNFGDHDYEALRKLVLTDPRSKQLAPKCLKANRNLGQFWQFIKGQFGHWAERRTYLWNEFAPLIEHLESNDQMPMDSVVSNVLSTFNAENVHVIWRKALERRNTDTEGAITVARTLLETVCKHILDEEAISYDDEADLPRLYKTAASHLNLSPGQHTENVFKQILGGCTSVVEGLGAMRNKLSDAHGSGARRVRPDSRHAELAVNLAGSMAIFLLQTYEYRRNPKKP